MNLELVILPDLFMWCYGNFGREDTTVNTFAVITVFQSVFCYDSMQSIMLLEDFVCLLFYA